MEKQILNTFIGNISHCVWWKDKNSVLLGCNENLAEFLGFRAPEQLIGKTDFDIWEAKEAEESLKIDKQVLSSGKPILNYVERKTKKNGEIAWFSKSKAPLYDEDNILIGTVGWHNDITHLKNLELSIDDKNIKLVEYNLQLEEANKKIESNNEDLERFTYAASHDLKGPIRNVKSFAQLLKGKNSLGQDSIEYLEIIISSASRMEVLVNNVLTFARAGISEVEAEPANIRAIIFEKIEDIRDLAERKSAEIEVNLTSKPIKCYPHLIGLVFYNLINNGIKFNESTKPKIEINLIEESDFYVFEVSDNGIGIKPESVEQVFEPFKRLVGSTIPGSGIGLSICKRVVEIHRGKIWIEKNKESGSIFKFTISKYL